MTSIRDYLTQYLSIRRNFGYRLDTSERVLQRFVEFAEKNEADHITVDLFLRWKEQFGVASNGTWSRRLGMIRTFAKWLVSIEPRTEVPPSGLIVGETRRKRPYIFTDDQIISIMEECMMLPSAYGIRAYTCYTLFGLLAVTGLRISEALKLDNEDVDLKEAVLTVKHGKNRKSRFVPISSCTVRQLVEYRNKRNKFFNNKTPSFFVFEEGQRPTGGAVRYNFAKICQNIGLREPQRFYKNGHGPRIHDLRHTYTVRTIMDWYRKGLDPNQEMSKLTTILGHSKTEYTYWYIEAVPELLELASQRATRLLKKGE